MIFRSAVWSFITSFVVLVFVIQCNSKDSFQENCLKSMDILQAARELLKTASSENILNKNGKIESTTTIFDNKDAITYLKGKSEELSQNYQKIKRHFNKDSIYYYDSLFVLAFINDSLYFLSGEEIEDRCYYIGTIKNEKEVNLSKWVMDEFFGPLLNNEETIKGYLDMSEKQKFEHIYGSLMVPEIKGKPKCN